MALSKIGGMAHMKAGFLGPPKGGKSYTAMLLNIACQEVLGKGPIAMYDTERGGSYLVKMVKILTGQDLLGCVARSFDKLIEFTVDCKKEGVVNGIVDSVTHPWAELCQSYLIQLNASRKRKGWTPLDRLEFQNWNYLKPKWNEFTTWYLASDMHVTICGRAGDIYEQAVNEETGRKELNITGQRMQTEKNTGYEPSLLVQMESAAADGGKKKLKRVATVVGDRFSVLDGSEFEFPSSKDHKKNLDAVMKAFGPHLDGLKGVKKPQQIDVESKSVADIDDSGDDGKYAEKREKAILLEEITGLLDSKITGTGVKGKRQELLKSVFQTYSKTKIEGFDSTELRDGLKALRAHFQAEEAPEAPKIPPPSDLPKDEDLPW